MDISIRNDRTRTLDCGQCKCRSYKIGRSAYQRCRLTMGADRHGNRGVAASRKTSRLLLLLTILPLSLSVSLSFKSNTTQECDD